MADTEEAPPVNMEDIEAPKRTLEDAPDPNSNPKRVKTQDIPTAVGALTGNHTASERISIQTQTKHQDGPRKIGYIEFDSGYQAFRYFSSLLRNLRKHQNLNDYEFHMVSELIKAGHPDAARKLKGDLHSIQIRDTYEHKNHPACFNIIHKDGTVEDVSYRKCLGTLFPNMDQVYARSSSFFEDKKERMEKEMEDPIYKTSVAGNSLAIMKDPEPPAGGGGLDEAPGGDNGSPRGGGRARGGGGGRGRGGGGGGPPRGRGAGRGGGGGRGRRGGRGRGGPRGRGRGRY